MDTDLLDDAESPADLANRAEAVSIATAAIVTAWRNGTSLSSSSLATAAVVANLSVVASPGHVRHLNLFTQVRSSIEITNVYSTEPD